MSGWSFILTFVGFGLTFWQIQKTRSAARAAEIAAKQAKSEALRFDAAFEVTRLVSSLKESLRHIGSGGWNHAVDSLREAQVSIVRLHDLHDRLDAADRATLNSMGNTLTLLQTKIIRSQSKGSQSVSAPKAIETLSAFHLSATRLSTRFEKVVK